MGANYAFIPACLSCYICKCGRLKVHLLTQTQLLRTHVCVCVCFWLCSCVWLCVYVCVSAPSKPTQKPQAMLSYGGVAMVTHRSITIHMPACFYSDDNGPITKIQVIVAESGGMTLKKH